MSIEENIQTVKNFFAAMGSGDRQRLLSLVAEDIEWIIPGEDWPLAGTHRGHAGLADVLQNASKMETSFPEPPEYVAQGDRVMVVGVATGKIKATNKPFKDHWVFAITIRSGKVANIREYIDTQALARAKTMNRIGSKESATILSKKVTKRRQSEPKYGKTAMCRPIRMAGMSSASAIRKRLPLESVSFHNML